MIKTTILALTTLFLSASLQADFNSLIKRNLDKGTIGEERIELKIVGSLDKHYLDGCGDVRGFHLAAEDLGNGTYRFNTYCGPVPSGMTKYTVIRQTGI